MFSTLRTRFGIPGVISVIALVFAMFGGAYAASNSSGGHAIASKAKKAKTGKRGPRGPKGATGPEGPQGLAGPQGPAGPQGAKGDPGTAGSPGTAGTSVTATELSIGDENCENGGSEFTSADSTTYACSGGEGPEGPAGPQGPQGPEGSPWTPGTLPKGATETGTWSFDGSVVEITTEVGGTKETVKVGDTRGVYVPISFTLPLGRSLSAEHVKFYNASNGEATKPEQCTGSIANPKVAEGYLCIYTLSIEEATFERAVQPTGFGTGATESGTLLKFGSLGKAAHSSGTWALTGS